MGDPPIFVSNQLLYAIHHTITRDAKMLDSPDNKIENDNATSGETLFVMQRVMDLLPIFSSSRRNIASTCRDLYSFDKTCFELLPDSSASERHWKSIDQYYERLVKLEPLPDSMIISEVPITVKLVRERYLTVQLRQLFELQHFIIGSGQYVCSDDLRIQLIEKLESGKTKEPNLSELEKIDALLNEVNEQIIQKRIDERTGCKSLDLNLLNLTRFPDAVIEKNLEFFKSLEILDCFINHLNRLPDSISLCQSLEHLDCQNNELQYLPRSLGKCLNLEELYCDSNRLNSLPEEIGGCQALKFLSCSGNILQALPESIGECQALILLDCKKNLLRRLPDSLGYCINLEILECNYNQLQSLPNSLGQCQELSYVICSHNQLQRLPDTLGQCRMLEELYCSKNQLTTIPSTLTQCFKLRMLDIESNYISHLPDDLIAMVGIQNSILVGRMRKSLDSISQGADDSSVGDGYDSQEDARPKKRARR